LFGTFSLLTGAILLFACASFFDLKNIPDFIAANVKWFIVSGLGYVLLNLGLYFLYQNFGASYYTLYAMLSILTTSILLATLVFGEKFNFYYALSILFAFLTIFFFMKAKQ
jgi:drug/metabolite transporter (DMT)-like permease